MCYSKIDPYDVLCPIPNPTSEVPMTGVYPPSIEVARLYEKTSQRGTKHMVRRLGLVRITLLSGDPAEDGTPRWRMMLQEAAKPQEMPAARQDHPPPAHRYRRSLHLAPQPVRSRLTCL